MRYWFLLFFLLLVGNAHAENRRVVLVGRHEGALDLLLSSDGKVAFTNDAEKTRIWDVEKQTELLSPPPQAGQVVAVNETGQQVLCCHRQHGDKGDTFDYVLWWRLKEDWRKGITVRDAVFSNERNPPLLDAVFTKYGLILLWPTDIERRGLDGQLRQRIPLKVAAHSVTPFPPGNLSRDGRYAITTGFVGDDLFDIISDAQAGNILLKRLSSEHHWDRAMQFSPCADMVAVVRVELASGVNLNELPDGWDGTVASQFLWSMHSRAEIEFDTPIPITFWPDKKKTLILFAHQNDGKLRIYDVDADKTILLPFFQPWGTHNVLKSRFSNNADLWAVLDEKGGIWVQPIRPIHIGQKPKH